MSGHSITMLGTGLIGDFYTMTLHGQRGRDRVHVVYSRSEERGRDFADRWGIPEATTSLEDAINHPETDVVVVGLPNFLHEETIDLIAEAGKAVLCTKPLARTAAEAKRILDKVEAAGVFAGYLEDLVYTPKTLKALDSVRSGVIGDVTWVRSRETHPGPHSAWFWDKENAGGGAIVDLGCHCIEIIRSYVGKDNRPIEVMAWADTLVHPIEAEDNAVVLIRFESGALGQFEVSWTFRGGMDLRDEVAGTEGTIWTNNFLRTGFEMYSSGGGQGYVAEKMESAEGWMFPVGDEVTELGYVHMFTDMFNSLDAGTAPRDVLRRLHRQRSDGRRLQVGREPPMGTGRGRVARGNHSPHRQGSPTPRRARHRQRRGPPRRPQQADPQPQGHRSSLRYRHRRVSIQLEVIPDDQWADRVTARWATHMEERPASRLCLPTGETPRPLYARAARSIDFGQATVFLLDEFGLPPGDPARCDCNAPTRLSGRPCPTTGGSPRPRRPGRGSGRGMPPIRRPRRRGRPRPHPAGPRWQRPRRAERTGNDRRRPHAGRSPGIGHAGRGRPLRIRSRTRVGNDPRPPPHLGVEGDLAIGDRIEQSRDPRTHAERTDRPRAAGEFLADPSQRGGVRR